MPPSTERVFALLSEASSLREFYLIGGTALALYLGHRLSEDLDFISTGQKLARKNIDAAIEILKNAGLSVERDDSIAAYDDFLNAGMNLHDYSQSFIVGSGCKLTFFAAEPHHRRLLHSPLKSNGPDIASLDELKSLKAIVCSFRSSSRDWLDLYILARKHNYRLENWKAAYEAAGLTEKHFNTALKRLTSGELPVTDPGYKSLLPNPPGMDEILEFFRQEIAEFSRS